MSSTAIIEALKCFKQGIEILIEAEEAKQTSEETSPAPVEEKNPRRRASQKKTETTPAVKEEKDNAPQEPEESNPSEAEVSSPEPVHEDSQREEAEPEEANQGSGEARPADGTTTQDLRMAVTEAVGRGVPAKTVREVFGAYGCTSVSTAQEKDFSSILQELKSL